jgi:phosphoglycolate phosphatase
LTRHDVSKVKPHPEHIMSALPALGVSPGEALMVGDHPIDIIAGKNAGCKSAMVLSGEGTLEDLSKVEPDYIAKDLEELMQQLKL